MLQRFANTGVRDQIAGLCIDGTAKFPSFLIPTVETQLERVGPVACAALALAGWRRYLATVAADERAPDSRGERAVELAAASVGDPSLFLELDLSARASDSAMRSRRPRERSTSTRRSIRWMFCSRPLLDSQPRNEFNRPGAVVQKSDRFSVRR